MMGDMILAAALLATAFLLTACASCPERPAQIITERVEVPVAQKATPSAALTSCGAGMALPQALELPAAPGSLLFPPDQARLLQLLLDGKQTCLESWKAWSAAP